MRIRTEAWVLYAGSNGNGRSQAGGRSNGNGHKCIDIAELKRETFEFDPPGDHEVLVEPISGCWEGNMNHALTRHPVDICRQRGEEKVVIGNAGVVRVLQPGAQAHNVKEGDLCLVFCNGVWDEHGYPKKIYAYDAPGTVGLLAKRTKLHERQLIPIPENSRHTLEQWAGFSLRFITAWANWRVAYGSWQLQARSSGDRVPAVWGWGGGVTLAELMLARLAGCEAAMISSQDERLNLIADCGLEPVDRRSFPDLSFETERYQNCAEYRTRYLESEKRFLEIVEAKTSARGVAIFIDFIGQPVFRATLKSLARPGVITTAGWKEGMDLALVRAVECMHWHVHVHTHYARYDEGVEAVEFGERSGWAPPRSNERYCWDDVPRLARDYAEGRTTGFFPTFEVNAA